MKPVLFGYLDAQQAMRYTAGRSSTSADRVAMSRFASREGFTLAQVFVERDTREPRPALESLIEAALVTEIAGVLVPDVSHLGRDPIRQDAARRRIECALAASVIAMRLT